MKFKEFSYEVRAEIELTLAEVDTLIELGQRHYDYRCQGETKPGGFIWGWRIQLAMASPEPTPICVRFQEVDLTCKILEQCDMDNPAHLALVVGMHRLIKQIGDEHRLRNEQGFISDPADT